ncbi:kinase-like domain-containing protein [Choanephora cucurbitarum]|nr:kinase-like domain-containing protein [Choanephora cucurbitarum]
MSEAQFLLEPDKYFYKDYAIPLVNSNPALFDMEDFASTIPTNEFIPPYRTIQEAYHRFENDKRAQWEMHPRFGRYVWDIADQWYQKWSVVFSVEHMWNWTEQGIEDIPQRKEQSFKLAYIQPWLNRIRHRYNMHPDHYQLFSDICQSIGEWNQSNRWLTLKGTFRLSMMPLFPPCWFKDKIRQDRNMGDLAPSFLATFVPPYRIHDQVPERWDQVFLKGLTADPTQKCSIETKFLTYAVHTLGLTVHIDEESGCSQLMLVMMKAKFGNLESHIEKEIPTDYLKPCQLALSITKDVKDLHWSYIHGNIHPRNVLLTNADYMGELIDNTFLHRNRDQQQNRLAGRWPYVAPEVASTGLSAAADMYALGVVLWQLISRVTFPNHVLVDPAVYRIEPIPGILQEWEDIYAACLQTDPTKRPSAYRVHRQLTQLCAQLQKERIPIAQQTKEYIESRREEIERFLSESKADSPMLQSYSSADDNSESSCLSTLCQDGDQVLTTSITRSYHPHLKNYPNLIHSFFP